MNPLDLISGFFSTVIGAVGQLRQVAGGGTEGGQSAAELELVKLEQQIAEAEEEQKEKERTQKMLIFGGIGVVVVIVILILVLRKK